MLSSNLFSISNLLPLMIMLLPRHLEMGTTSQSSFPWVAQSIPVVHEEALHVPSPPTNIVHICCEDWETFFDDSESEKSQNSIQCQPHI